MEGGGRWAIRSIIQDRLFKVGAVETWRLILR
jgi:hypothetical protein